MKVESNSISGVLRVPIDSMRHMGLKMAATFAALDIYRLVYRHRWIKKDGCIYFPIEFEKIINHYPVWDNLEDAKASIEKFAELGAINIVHGNLGSPEFDTWVSYNMEE